MGYFGYGWRPYVPVAKRRAQSAATARKAAKKGAPLSPVGASSGKIAKTFWGRAWCDNLERYSDFENRLPRGRTYLRNGSVIDLVIGQGEVKAQVAGSSLYTVTIKVQAVPETRWRAITAECAGSIDSLVELLQGRLSDAVMTRICMPGTGLFPAPAEIKLDCSCPDWADMCKHVAATLYGVGARLDTQPELLFQLRQVDAADLVKHAGAGLPRTGPRPSRSRVLDDAQLGDVFGIEMAGATPAQPQPAVDPTPKAAPKAALKAVPKAPPASSKASAEMPAKQPAKAPAKTLAKATRRPPAKAPAKAPAKVPKRAPVKTRSNKVVARTPAKRSAIR